MARSRRSVHAQAFEEAREFTFDAQLYHALRASPWWMISLAFHVLVFLVSSALATEMGANDASAQPIEVAMSQPMEPPELRPDPGEIDVKSVVESKLETSEPVPDPDVLSKDPETDDDEPWHETMGEEGTAFSPWTGPSANADIGLGLAAGSPFGKRGRGGSENAGSPGGSRRRDTMRDAVEDALRQVREGGSLSRALGKTKLFPPMVIHLIASGEATGKLDQMLQRAADAQTRELENWVRALTALLEPLLILVMGAIVLFIVIAILLPIFEMNQLIK